MKIPLSWLQEMIDLDLPPHQIGKLLTMAGIEVEETEVADLPFRDVVVGKVVEVERHPDAEKLQIAKVSDGAEEYQVVCGAPNCRPGIKTAFAKLGAQIDGSKIKKGKLRGVESYGMLCSGKELGLSDDHDGIMELSDRFQEGADLALIYAETVMHLSLTPNLGHCASILGIARELSAILEKPYAAPEPQLNETGEKTASSVRADVENREKCPRYMCRLVRNVKPGPSPDWMQKRLIESGFRPVNNIVDVTNYVQLELGHPLHAFDFDRVEGGRIVVRNAQAGETVVTLDEKERRLVEDDLLICDDQKPVAIAGVMGCSNTEVGENTSHVLLESAYFQPASVRRTSKRLGLQTESSRRFERACDPNNAALALDRAAELIAELADGDVLTGAVDEKETPFQKRRVSCRLSRVHTILGVPISMSEAESIFKRLEMTPRWDGRDRFDVEVPTYRADVQEEIDLVEEVARIYGYDNFPKKEARHLSSAIPDSPIYLFERKVRERLLAEGLQEFLTCDLIGPSHLEMVGGNIMPERSRIQVLNPSSIEQSVLRTSLLHGLLQVVKFNVDHQTHSIAGFEVGKVHYREQEMYREQSVASIILSGSARPWHWEKKPEKIDFYDLKGVIENLFSELLIPDFSFKAHSLPQFHPGRQAAIYSGSRELGAIGEVHPAIQRKLDTPHRVCFAEINLHELLRLVPEAIRMEEVPSQPASDRDWTVALSEAIPMEAVLALLKKAPSKLLESVKLIDLYAGKGVEEGKRNATFHFVYRHPRKTLSQEVVDQEHQRIISQCTKNIESQNY